MDPTAIERAPFGGKRWIKQSNQQPNVVVAAPVAVLLAWIMKWVHRQRNNSRQHFSSRAVSAAQAAWLIHWSSFAQGTHLLYFWLLYGMLASTKMNPTKLPMNPSPQQPMLSISVSFQWQPVSTETSPLWKEVELVGPHLHSTVDCGFLVPTDSWRVNNASEFCKHFPCSSAAVIQGAPSENGGTATVAESACKTKNKA